jgi:hypothetical protein
VQQVFVNGAAVVADGAPLTFSGEPPPGRWLKYRRDE